MQPSHRNWRFGVWLAWRDRRASHLRLMALVLMVTVAATSAVGFLAGRVQQALFADAQASLGGDRLLVSDRPIPKDWIEAALETGLQFTQGVQFPSMALGPTALRLVAIKAVQPPIRLRVVFRSMGIVNWRGGCLPGSIPRCSSWALAWGIRSTWASRFRVSGWIVQEPDRGIGFVNFSPRVMMRQEALPRRGFKQRAVGSAIDSGVPVQPKP